MPYLPLKDATIYYEVEGDGYPIILIHGMGLSHLNWRPQVEYLTQHGYKTITLDIRGHGRSTETLDRHKNANIIKQITEDTFKVLKGLNVHYGIFVGYSTGTVHVQDFALTYPHMAKGIVLTGAFPKIHNLYLFGKFTSSMFLTYLRGRKILENGVARSNGKDNEQISLFRQEAKKVKKKEALRLMKAALRYDCRERLKEISVPMLVTYGGNERHMMTYRQDYLTLAPKAEVCLFPNVNHATPTKCTESYNLVLLDFFESISQNSYVKKDNSDHFLNPNMMHPIPSPMRHNLE
jgi:pimeloyl-ACP methyl ester carboxylesterase